MSEDLVTIEVDGKPLKARKGTMLIEVTDNADIYIPRFCYHKKLTVAANCRMCLVEVEKAPKPLPACATPVMDGMKVWTQSAKARDAQQGTMEFLLINHPLDCPICDQGGECELQDLAVGFGGDVSRYTEGKRVVKDKNIGPLIQTDMTRCIHCTRCVRFGEEVAGLREMGATGRGENMQIGTYIEKTVVSEMSGNIIDLCPVGALTSKPYRYSARAWELRSHEAIAPHDSVGSNIHVHVKGKIVKRVVPRENEVINEVWISDRDRYSYAGLYSDDRLVKPMVKQSGQWQEVDWEVALKFTAEGLSNSVKQYGPQQLGALASPSSTLEELYLLQKLVRGLGGQNIDHRLRQTDFSDQDAAPLYPGLGQTLADLEKIDAALLIGSYVRQEQPIVNHRLRKAALKGAAIMAINPVDYSFNYDLQQKLIVAPAELAKGLAGIAKALMETTYANDKKLSTLLLDVEVTDQQRAIAEKLATCKNGTVLLGNFAMAHPAFSTLRSLAGTIAKLCKAKLGYLAEAGNSCGAWLVGAVPHREAGGKTVNQPGLDVNAMFEPGLKSYLLLGVEPEFDSAKPALAMQALKQSDFTVVVTAYKTPAMLEYAKVLLPMALFAENPGTYVNLAGQVQSTPAAVVPPGEARPAWKILRVLGNLLNLDGYTYNSASDVAAEITGKIQGATADNAERWQAIEKLPKDTVHRTELVVNVPMYSVDSLVRRSLPLQATQQNLLGKLSMSSVMADNLRLKEGDMAELQQYAYKIQLPVTLDERLPPTCVAVAGAQAMLSGLVLTGGPVEVKRAVVEAAA